MKKGFEIVNEEVYKGYKIYVMEVENNISSLFWWDATNSPSYFNGYIVLPEDSKFYGKDYDFINKEIKVHGEFEFIDFVEGEYTIGFDTTHIYDNETTRNIDFVLEELKQAVDQIIQQELKYDVEKVIKKELRNIVEQIFAKKLGEKMIKKVEKEKL